MPLDRRSALRAAALGIGTLAAGPLVAACSSGGGGRPVENLGTAPARRGGVLRAAFVGAGAGEALDPFVVSAPAENTRVQLVYDQLFALADGRALPRLAVAADPAPDGSSMTLRLREGVRFHDGTPLRAADVAWSLRYLTAPERPFPSELAGFFDLAAMRVLDDRTVLVPTRTPVGDPASVLASAGTTWVVREGTTTFEPGRIVGTGPYRQAAYAAGRESRLARFDGHWGPPPAADEIVVLSIDDATARVNAVRAGQADYAGDVPYTVARTGVGDPELEIRTAGPAQRTAYGFVLNTTGRPFDDPRARLAVRLGVDRRALVDRVLLGYGVPGADLFGTGARYFADPGPPPARDVERARRLLAEAGAAGAPVAVRTADYEYGYNAATELFVQQLRDLGLDARSEVVGVPEFFGPGVERAQAVAFSLGPYPLSVTYARLAAYPSLALPDAVLSTAVSTAFAATDESARAEAWRRAQQVMVDRGNWVVWGLADTLSLARRSVTGLQVQASAKYPYLGTAGFA